MANHEAKGRPRLEPNKDCERIGISLPRSLAKRLQDELDRIEIPRSEMIRQLIESWLSRRGK